MKHSCGSKTTLIVRRSLTTYLLLTSELWNENQKTHMALTCHCCLSHLPPPRYLKLRKERQPRPPPQHGCVPAGRDRGFYSQSLSSGTALLQFQQTCGTGHKNSELQAVWAPAHEAPQCGQDAWDED